MKNNEILEVIVEGEFNICTICNEEINFGEYYLNIPTRAKTICIDCVRMIHTIYEEW